MLFWACSKPCSELSSEELVGITLTSGPCSTRMQPAHSPTQELHPRTFCADLFFGGQWPAHGWGLHLWFASWFYSVQHWASPRHLWLFALLFWAVFLLNRRWAQKPPFLFGFLLCWIPSGRNNNYIVLFWMGPHQSNTIPKDGRDTALLAMDTSARSYCFHSWWLPVRTWDGSIYCWIKPLSGFQILHATAVTLFWHVSSDISEQQQKKYM